MPATSTAPDFSGARARVAHALGALCDRALPSIGGPVGDAMRYSISGEGKRLRAVLVMLTYEACGGTGDVAPLAAAVEVVHAYSLVHDDLPCMDDDDMRRGRPTVHRMFGVPIATAAGVAMVPFAALSALAAARGLGLDEVALVAERTRLERVDRRRRPEVTERIDDGAPDLGVDDRRRRGEDLEALARPDPAPVQMGYAVEVRLLLAREDEFKRPDTPALANGLFRDGDRGRQAGLIIGSEDGPPVRTDHAVADHRLHSPPRFDRIEMG